MNKKNIFYNFPEALKKEDYEETCQLVVLDLKKNQDILSIYAAGSSWMPGISDLDIIVVYKNNSQKLAFLKSPWDISEKAKAIFIHRYENYNEKTFSDIAYLTPSFKSENMKLLFGEPLTWRRPDKELSQSEYNWLQAIFLFDLLINKLLLIYKYSFQKRIDVHELVVVISSLSHTIKLINGINQTELETDFLQKTERLRGQWFSRSQLENINLLLELFDEAQNLVLKFIKELDVFLQRETPDFIKEIEKRKFSFVNEKYNLIFIPNWQENYFISEFKKGFRKFDFSILGLSQREDLVSYRLILPNTLFFFIGSYLKSKGPLTDWIKRGAEGNYWPILDKIILNNGLNNHIKATNNYLVEGLDFKGATLKLWFSYGLFPYKRSLKRKIIDLIILFRKLFI